MAPPSIVLLVDDESGVLSSLKRLLRSQSHEVLTALSGEEALETLAARPVDLIISDMRMPRMSGADLLARVQLMYPDTMRILLTGYAEIEAVVRTVNEGEIYRYLNKPWDDQDLLLTVAQALEQRRLRKETERLIELTRRTVMFLEEAQTALKRSFASMMQICANMVELRCRAPGGQSARVGEMVRQLAVTCGLSEVEVQDTYFAGLLHGIGKLSLPDELLRKSLDQMSPDESRLFHRHPSRAQMVSTPIQQLHAVASIILHQYERYNGRGTPDALSGADIPLGSRILAVARDFEGLSHGDIARQRLSREQAIGVINGQSAIRDDPQVVGHFVTLMKNPAAFESVRSTREVASTELVEGMRLADDLRTNRGVLLMTRDSVMSAHHIELIRRYELSENSPFSFVIHTERSAPSDRTRAPGFHVEA
ncbi:response regulator [Paraburkholderia sp. SARCC-3016]|uniref:HD domain-containing phosphohydrolase n=1 Tax=Paraburkholderia sp. SARCC-3016 TaxID=3058611 RepID=UPI002807D8CA|nr:HD domain-containing phosphohydrolase [Paraburkholderia sp. SARCC-3016]MDQ7981718.1 response regulator [Paraburkholderia sp. SARCC-3016]